VEIRLHPSTQAQAKFHNVGSTNRPTAIEALNYYAPRTLASRLGMTAENLSRSLTSLKKHGVTARGRDIFVADRRVLRALAKPSLLIDG
jgi:Crp-like helix-turn-helix protein